MLTHLSWPQEIPVQREEGTNGVSHNIYIYKIMKDIAIKLNTIQYNTIQIMCVQMHSHVQLEV